MSSKYKKVLFIAYEINTFPRQQGATMVYTGYPDDMTDANARIALMKQAMEKAHTDLSNSKYKSNQEQLVVFMAPEFYFRGVYGAYEFDTVQHVLDSLQKEVIHQKWDDWLFSFGTVLGQARPESPPKIVDNISMVKKGGTQPGEGVNITIKEFKSVIDYIKWAQSQHKNNNLQVCGRWAYDEIVQHAGRLPKQGAETRTEVKVRPDDSAAVFMQDGIKFGVSICLDHLIGRLRKSKDYVQIELIPSAGACINAETVATVNNGLALNCDGYCGSQAAIITDIETTNANKVATVNAVQGDMLLSDIHYTMCYKKCFTTNGQLRVYGPLDIPA